MEAFSYLKCQMKNISVGDIPKHKYIWVDTNFTHKQFIGYIPALWFALNSVCGRSWGLHVLLECGAFFRNIPPHAILFEDPHPLPTTTWSIKQAQRWDCYSQNWSAIEYRYLANLRCKAAIDAETSLLGTYLFSVCPLDDGFTAYPEQAKEFMFIQLDNGRLTIQPTNCVLFRENSFTVNDELLFPKDLKASDLIYSSEE